MSKLPKPTNYIPIFTPILLSLTTLAIYLITGSLITNRISPPIFLTVSLGLLVAAYYPNLGTSISSIGLILFINILLALDHIHGECAYEVMVGGKSWHKERLGELEWYKQCVQPSQAWWIMVLVGLLWLSIAILEILRIYRIHKRGIKLPTHISDEEENN